MDNNPTILEDKPKQLWAIIELFGHKQIAGLTWPEEFLGKPMLRVDVPPVSPWPGFTRYLSPDAIYSLTYVSEEAGRLAAEQFCEKPVAAYIPDLDNYARAVKENQKLYQKLQAITEALSKTALPDHILDEDYDSELGHGMRIE